MRTRPVDAVTTDVRFALRTLRKAPGFTAVVMLTLALGIGATTAIFTIVDAVMLRPYPYADMDRIVMLAETTRTGQTMSIAWANFQDWREQNQVFEHLGIYRGTVLNLTGGDQPERLIASLASSEVFKAVGLQAMIGRTFTADEDRAGAPRVAVVSERFWRTHLDADASAIGRSIMLDGESHIVVGVMPAGMRFPSRTTDVWLPAGPVRPDISCRSRRAPGVVRRRQAENRHRCRSGVGRHGRDCAPPRAAVPDVEHRSHRLGGALLRADRPEHPACAARALGCRRVRAAHRLREPRQSDAGARRQRDSERWPFAKRSARAGGASHSRC